MACRILGSEDAPGLLVFLERHLDSSMLLVSNAEAAGIVDQGQPLQGTYVGAFADGALTAVAGHFWNGFVIVQGDAGLEEAARAAVERTGRAVNGLIGPLSLVERARRALGLERRIARRDEAEVLYVLRLERLRTPSLLSSPRIAWRPPNERDIDDVLVEWRASYFVEALGAEPTPSLRDEARALLQRTRAQSLILVEDGAPVSLTTFTAQARGAVQVGGVYTPPALRGRGYARAVVAASLLEAREAGAKRSVLFTAGSNVAARRAYTALGYEETEAFGLVLFA
jgi:ribosomal protein S18 acetylase RimI-like enzyme